MFSKPTFWQILRRSAKTGKMKIIVLDKVKEGKHNLNHA